MPFDQKRQHLSKLFEKSFTKNFYYFMFLSDLPFQNASRIPPWHWPDRFGHARPPRRQSGRGHSPACALQYCNIAITAGCFICDDACIARQHIPGTTMDAIIMPGVFIP
ncbi:hypothetical protein [Novacetimonas hansenii]|uniref:hypothetical protein n=1 Tax=Novacetimonas hansenii TaxID=436 RepID=UPI0011153F4C|nr:hypothetical protein [Novacetimonas hansenii]